MMLLTLQIQYRYQARKQVEQKEQFELSRANP